MPLLDPNGAFGYADGEWKLWKQPFVRRGDDWVEPKGVWVRKDGEWVHVWTDKIPVDDMAVVATPVNMDTAAEIELAWIVPFSVRVAESYVVYRPDGTVVGTTTEAGMVDAAPVPGVGAYSVVALAGDEEFMTSVSNSGRIAQAPSGLTATQSGDAVTLAWSVDSVGVHDHIQVVRNASPDQAWNLPFGTTSWTDPSAGVGGQVNSYKVRALVHSTPGPYSAEASVSVPANVPTNVTVAATTTIGELKLTYSAPSSGSVTGYQVQANNGSWVAASSNNSGATYKFTGSGSKSMRVLAKSAGGNSAYVTKSATPLWTAKPNVPKSVSVAATSTVGQLKLTWSAPSADSTHSAASTYQVQTSTNNSSWTTVSGNKTSPYTHSFGSSGSGARYMRVRATNGAGSSSYVSKSGTPLWALPTPAKPTFVHLMPKSSYGKMYFKFKMPSSNVAKYQIRHRINGGSWVNGTATNSSNNAQPDVNVKTLTKNQKIETQVRAGNSTGQWSSWAGTWNYTVLESPLYVAPISSGHYRQGMWGRTETSWTKPYQDYFDNSAYAYQGYYFYGDSILTTLSQLNSGGVARTVSSATVVIQRPAAGSSAGSCGSGSENQVIYMGTHAQKTNPGKRNSSVPFAPISNISGVFSPATGGTNAPALSTAAKNALVNGTQNGVGFDASPWGGKPYLCFMPQDPNALYGWIAFNHLG
jgi:hypothetical protein